MSYATPAEIAVRAYTELPGKKPVTGKGAALDTPSDWVLVFDTETTIDPSQALRIGSFQVRKGGVLQREGLFCEQEHLTPYEAETVQIYAEERGLDLLTLWEFRRLFLKVGAKLNGTIVGFNLPFDISRIAVSHGPARGSMRGGFSFKLSWDWKDPDVRVKHLSAKAALIDFAAPYQQRTARSGRKRGDFTPVHRGFFVDVKTLAAALTSRSFSLESLCAFLETPTRKAATEKHGETIKEDYLDYARSDVQATWECYAELMRRFGQHGLSKPAHRILSEASIGKAYLEDMGVQPLLACQPEFPRECFGQIMCSYYGGRAEVNLRRVISRVLYCDFKSMYPTVNALMGLWSFVIGVGVTWKDTTEDTRVFLARVTLEDLQNSQTWHRLRRLVKLKPDGDILPIRAKYDGKSYTIGQNELSLDQPLWFTLADVIASKLRSGKTLDILEAISFEPGPAQYGLKPIDLFGNPAYRVDPLTEDVFSRLVDLRDEAKAAGDPIQKAIKIVANATSYGIFIEIIRNNAPKPEVIHIHGFGEAHIEIQSTALEEPGRYFHPLLGTLITGAARLMLALAEQRTLEEGLDWVFCDTDSLAIAKPEDMPEAEFLARAHRVIDWFTPLNPYRKQGSILQVEDVNFKPETRELEPLFAWAISAKRYALFTLSADGHPVLRKASQHGLGHLLAPYDADEPAPGIPDPRVELSEIGVHRWQYDLWFQIVKSALEGHPDQVPLDYHPKLQEKALSRYGATSPALLSWMKYWNADKPYRDQVKPFGFLSAFTAVAPEFLQDCTVHLAEPGQRGRPSKPKRVKPIAPYERDPKKAVRSAFDRETGEPVLPAQLQSYGDMLARYHLSSETKFENGLFLNQGRTRRRHVMAHCVRLIGKEANSIGEGGDMGPIPERLIDLDCAELSDT